LIILSNDSLDGKDVAEDKKSVPRRDRGSNRSRRKYSPADADMVELAVSELISASMRVNMSERSFNIPLPSYAKGFLAFSAPYFSSRFLIIQFYYSKMLLRFVQ
jgi:hypothetical protein